MTEQRIGNWVRKGTRLIFENQFFKVSEDDVIEPSGKDGKYATIDFKPGVAILPFDDEGNVYLTRQFRYALGRDSIEAVAGTVEGEEELIDAAKREAIEEIGLEADEWISLGKIEVLTSICRAETNLYIARKISFRAPENESTEDIRPLKLPFTHAIAMAAGGEITHSDTCSLIFRAVEHEKMQRPTSTAAEEREEQEEKNRA